jgi:hypothetical protein
VRINVASASACPLKETFIKWLAGGIDKRATPSRAAKRTVFSAWEDGSCALGVNSRPFKQKLTLSQSPESMTKLILCVAR